MKRTQSEIFLHAFAIVEGFFDLEEDNLEHLSAIFKEKILTFNTKEDIESFLKKIKKYTEIYLQFPKIDKDTSLSFEEDEKRLFHILKITETNTIMPLILALKIHCNEGLEKCFKILEIFIIRRWLCGKTTKAYNKIFAICVKKLNENNYKEPTKILKEQLLKEIPQDVEMKDSLESKPYQLSNKKATLILFWIELFRRYQNKNMQDSTELPYIFTLEHLVPQEWQTHWSDVVENEEKAKEFIYQIGNMTLLKGALNSAIKNATWQIKLNGDKSRRNCIEKCADLLITRELLNKEQWNEDSIKERTEKLSEDFFKIWDINVFNNESLK